MTLTQRKELLARLGNYMLENDAAWQSAQRKAYTDNNWFTQEFVELSVKNIVHNFLQPHQLDELASKYQLADRPEHPKKVGIVMAGNIPLVGFHDFLCVFLSGHIALIKPSSKDEALIKHLVNVLTKWEPEVAHFVAIMPLLKGCEAYIATGSNNSGRYFEHYFGKYPNIIRKNRTSVAILTGKENAAELEQLADDIHQYFGLGCRNVTKLYVPEGYDFVPLLDALRKYAHLADHNKFKNNYDYQLAGHILNNKYYMTNGTVLLIEDPSPFAPISQVHYQFYKNVEDILPELKSNDAIQCIAGEGFTPFGNAQQPGICDFADGVDTMAFLKNL